MQDVKVKDLKREYDKTFVPSAVYLNSMPDLQNSGFTGIPIDMVGIHDFKMPLYVKTKQDGLRQITASISGTVSLDANSRGINMSRIIRTFYKSGNIEFDINELERVLKNYQKDLNTFESNILMNFEYPLWQPALRSLNENGYREGGWQYYNITFDTHLDSSGRFRKVLWLDFVYSSACPCSTALSEHAALMRGVYGIPHSQRSVARIGIEFDDMVWIEDVIDWCRTALKTETLVFCKRQDEQAFAELNGANVKFVEDAIRLLADELNKHDNVIDYKIICSHLESLHSHNAISVLTKGLPNSKFANNITVDELKSLVR